MRIEVLEKRTLTSGAVKITIADATHMFSSPVPHAQDKNNRHSFVPFLLIQTASGSSPKLMLTLS